jgi:hypothetical protein
MHPVAARRRWTWGRWLWGLSGLVTILALGIPGARLIAGAGSPAAGQSPMIAVPSRPIVITQPVTSVRVESYGAQIQVAAGPVQGARAVTTITYFAPAAGPPAVTAQVSRGVLTLAAPVCRDSDCSVGFQVTVPAGATVTAVSDGGPITVTGLAGANLDSGGGTVRATGIHGPLTVSTDGGALTAYGIGGPLHADTGGGPLLARRVAAATATLITEGGGADVQFTGTQNAVTVGTGGGGAQLRFTAPPQSVTVTTDGGPALLTVPGGPYAVAAESDGAPQVIGIATDPTAHRSLAVTSGGGPLQIEPATGHASARLSSISPARIVPPLPPVPPVPPQPARAA